LIKHGDTEPNEIRIVLYTGVIILINLNDKLKRKGKYLHIHVVSDIDFVDLTSVFHFDFTLYQRKRTKLPQVPVNI